MAANKMAEETLEQGRAEIDGRGPDAVTLGDVKTTINGDARSAIISAEEKAFALRLWRTRVREIRDLEERYGFKLESK